MKLISILIIVIIIGMLMLLRSFTKKKGCEACEYYIVRKCQLGGTVDPDIDVMSCELRSAEEY